MIRLRVWANELPMGWFGHQAGQYFFQYDEDWLKSAHAYVLAPQFVLRTEPHLGEQIKTFFANLLPEGAALEEILSAIHMRDASTFEIIGQLGGELPGVLSVRAEGNADDQHIGRRLLQADGLPQDR